MGSIGANRNSASGQSPQDFVNNLVNDITRDVNYETSPEDLISSGDIQSIVEAYAMTHPNVDEEELLKSVREAVEAKINPLSKFDKPAARLTTHYATDIKAGDTITDEIIKGDGTKKNRVQWTFHPEGQSTFKETPYSDIIVTEVKAGPKTTKVTGKFDRAITKMNPKKEDYGKDFIKVTKTFKNEDIIQKRGKKR